MIKDIELQIITTTLLLIASADGALNENDKKIITSYLNKHYKSGEIIWTKPKKRSPSPLDKYKINIIDDTKETEPYDILKAAVDTLNSPDRYVHEVFSQALSSLDFSSEVTDLWNKIAGDSQKRKDVVIALFRKIYWP